MTIANLILHIDLPQANSLKGRLAITNSVKEALKKFNISVLDISGEYVKEAEIAVVYVSANDKLSAQILQSIEKMLEQRFPELLIEFDLEMF